MTWVVAFKKLINETDYLPESNRQHFCRLLDELQSGQLTHMRNIKILLLETVLTLLENEENEKTVQYIALDMKTSEKLLTAKSFNV